jgi:alpha-L-rhamnosidase
MNSFNHYAYGAIGEWIYGNVAGIRADPDHPGFKNFIIRPLITSRLDQVSAWHLSPYGRIVSEWKTVAGKLQMNLTVPANSTARVYIPRQNGSEVLESGLPLGQADGILGTQEGEDHLIVEVGSGEYHFESKNPE